MVTDKIYSGVSHRLVWLLALAVFINYVDRGTLATAAPLVRAELGLSNTEMGVLLSAFFWTYTAMQPIAGWVAQRFDVRIVYALGFAIWALATTLTVFTIGFLSLFLLRLLLGIGESVTFPCTSKVLAESSLEHERGRANGLIMAGCGIGPSVGTLAGGLLMAAHGWRIGFLVFGLSSLLWLWPWLSSVVPTERRPTFGTSPFSYSSLLRQRALWGASLGHFCFNYGYYFVLTWLPLYLVNSRGLSLSQMSVVGAVVYGVFAISSALTGRVSDHWITSGWPVNRVRKGVMVTALFGAAVFMLGCSVSTSHVSELMLVIAAFFFGLGSPQIFAIAQTLAGPSAGGQWMGIQNTVGNLSGIAAPIITGWTVEITGEYYAAFLLTGTVLVLGALVWGLLVPRVEQVRWHDTRAA
jgi:MFS family permease